MKNHDKNKHYSDLNKVRQKIFKRVSENFCTANKQLTEAVKNAKPAIDKLSEEMKQLK